MTYPVANEVAKKLVSGENPLDFIKKNIAARTTAEINPEQALKAEEEKRAAAVPQEAPKEESPTTAIPSEEPKHEEIKPQTPEPPKVELQPGEEPGKEGEEDIENSIAINFKNIRKNLNETKTQLTAKEQELKAAKEELEKYKTGEVLPEVLQKKEAEIARLSKFEKILSLKTTPEYQEKFIKPLSGIKAQLTAIANDYRIPPDQLLRAVGMRNQADLNRFLTSHLDDGGFLEVKQLIKQAQNLQDQAHEAEKEPQTALQKILSEGEEAKLQRLATQRESLRTTSRDVWDEAYSEIKKEGKALELIYKEDDPEHNEKFVEPIVKQAATEFGKTITMLAENGLEKMPKELGIALAKSFLLAHASAVSLETRTAMANHAEEILKNQERTRRIYRPPVGSTSPGTETTSQTQQKLTPAEAGRSLINNVLASRRK